MYYYLEHNKTLKHNQCIYLSEDKRKHTFKICYENIKKIKLK